ncbi:MAG: AraC family transcriptional regulator [Christensenellaceae bacterium]|nr:AraC family transcriptional regulator [Christensenellaceae bacterium]
MNHFEQISGALQYIDSHLAEPVTLAMLAEQCHFSPFYFHRLFTAVVGKSLAAYIRDRKILHACRLLAETDRSMLDIALDSGFQSAQAFSRAFRDSQGMSAREYRRQGCRPVVVTAEELIVRFTNRLRGGVLVNPMLIRRGPLRIAGTCGDGSRTGEVWQRFMRLREEKPLTNAASESGYEVRLYQGGGCTVHVGQCVSGGAVDPAYSVVTLPASRYAVFDVYVARGYESENSAMEEWLATNAQGYVQRRLDPETDYCVEFYDERFENGDGIVEIWVPIEKAD